MPLRLQPVAPVDATVVEKVPKLVPLALATDWADNHPGVIFNLDSAVPALERTLCHRYRGAQIGACLNEFGPCCARDIQLNQNLGSCVSENIATHSKPR